MPPTRLDRRAVTAWCLFDFANSAYTTLIVTFIYATYFTQAIAPDEIRGTGLWSLGVTITALTVALLSPMLGALADRGHARHPLLVLSTLICIAGTVMLYFPLPGQVTLALTWFVVSNIAFEMGNVFYNAYLPDIAPPEKVGRISGYGWGLGYLGGLLALVIALFAFVQPEIPLFGFSKENGAHIRATNLLVAVWFGVFSLPMLLRMRDVQPDAKPSRRAILADSFGQLARTLREIRRYRQIVRLLVARLVYNDGLVTIFAFGAIYAAGTFGFTTEEIIYFGIALNVTAGLGAYLFGFVDDRIGGKKTLLITVTGLFFTTLFATLAPSKAMLWAAGLVIGLFVGPNQAASRSLLARFVPREKETEFFGFYAFSGKATAFLGPLLLGRFTEWFGSQRVGVGVLLVFFLVGGLLLLRVDEEEGKRIGKEVVPQDTN